jgi:hypothetical protein
MASLVLAWSYAPREYLGLASLLQLEAIVSIKTIGANLSKNEWQEWKQN